MIFFGRNVVLEALSSNHKIKNIYLQEGINKDNKISEILSLAEIHSVSLKYLSSKELRKIFNSDDHQGVGIEIDYHTLPLSKEALIVPGAAYIYISEATYEHNIGAIIRTAECAGIHGVIIPNDIKITPTIAKTSAGGIFSINIYQESIFNAIKKFKDSGYSIVGIERDGKKYFDIDLTGNVLFIIGGEDKSLSSAVRKDCNEIAEIPQFGKVNSLNMSVASSIILYDRVRQQITNSLA